MTHPIRRPMAAALASHEFRSLWAADVQSVLGGQIARVGLALLAYDRTGSAPVTAVIYACTMVPDVVGGVFLSGLGDRFARREVMIACDVTRMLLVAAMAWPGMPLPALAVLLVAAQLVRGPFSGAQSATVTEVLTGLAYEGGQELRQIGFQMVSLLGFAAGGVVVVAIGPSAALLLDAATFGVSALLLRFGVAARPVPELEPGSPSTNRTSAIRRVRDSIAVILRDAPLRLILAAACLAGLSTVLPEALAAPWLSESHAPAALVGIVLALDPLGFAVGTVLLRRLDLAVRLRLYGVLALATCLLLVPIGLKPPMWLGMTLVACSAVVSAYWVTGQVAFPKLVPIRTRAQTLGLARSTLATAQGIGILASGLIAQAVGSAGVAIGVLSALGTITAGVIAAAWSRNTDPAAIRKAVTANAPEDGSGPLVTATS